MDGLCRTRPGARSGRSTQPWDVRFGRSAPQARISNSLIERRAFQRRRGLFVAFFFGPLRADAAFPFAGFLEGFFALFFAAFFAAGFALGAGFLTLTLGAAGE